jgi:RNA polymerase sigma-70 factor (ECF subfamily)
LHSDEEPRADGAARPAADADEARLIERVQRGDTGAYDLLVRRHLRRAYHLAYRILERREDAEDLVQEAFMVALDRIDTFDVARPFAPWLSRIVLTRALNARKAASRRRGAPLGDDALSTEASPLAEAETNDVHERVRAALASLPERQRVIIQLFELDGYSAQEVADLLGLSAGTVRWHAHEARRTLRELLDPLFGETAEPEPAPRRAAARSSEGERR